MKTESTDLASDLLEGAAAISEFIYGTPTKRRKVYGLASDDRGPENKLPCFRMGELLCARKSTLLAWIAAREKTAA